MKKGRVYSFTGCFTCRRRKKRCDEAKPRCQACVRLRLTCSYGIKQERKPTQSWPLNADLLVRESQALNTTHFRNETEELIVARVPESARAFFTPFSSEYTRELKDLWQMMFQDELVRNSLVACFSVVLGRSPEHGRLNILAYDRVVTLLRESLSQGLFDKNKNLRMCISINFLGLLQSVGPDTPIDPLQHFKGLAILLENSPELDLRIWPTIPRNLYILLLESLLYHLSALGIFSRNIALFRNIWHNSKLSLKLKYANPEGPERIIYSPLLCGRYALFEMALELTSLHRSPLQRSRLKMATLDNMERALDSIQQELPTAFLPTPSKLATYRNAVSESYKIFCDSLYICIWTLRAPTEHLVKLVDLKTLEALKKFKKLPLVSMAYEARLWGFQILGCAIRHAKDFRTFMEYFEKFKTNITQGHITRAERLFNAAQDLRMNVENHGTYRSDSEEDFTRFPVGLLVLRNVELVLPQETA